MKKIKILKNKWLTILGSIMIAGSISVGTWLIVRHIQSAPESSEPIEKKENKNKISVPIVQPAPIFSTPVGVNESRVLSNTVNYEDAIFSKFNSLTELNQSNLSSFVNANSNAWINYIASILSTQAKMHLLDFPDLKWHNSASLHGRNVYKNFFIQEPQNMNKFLENIKQYREFVAGQMKSSIKWLKEFKNLWTNFEFHILNTTEQEVLNKINSIVENHILECEKITNFLENHILTKANVEEFVPLIEDLCFKNDQLWNNYHAELEGIKSNYQYLDKLDNELISLNLSNIKLMSLNWQIQSNLIQTNNYLSAHFKTDTELLSRLKHLADSEIRNKFIDYLTQKYNKFMTLFNYIKGYINETNSNELKDILDETITKYNQITDDDAIELIYKKIIFVIDSLQIIYNKVLEMQTVNTTTLNRTMGSYQSYKDFYNNNFDRLKPLLIEKAKLELQDFFLGEQLWMMNQKTKEANIAHNEFINSSYFNTNKEEKIEFWFTQLQTAKETLESLKQNSDFRLNTVKNEILTINSSEPNYDFAKIESNNNQITTDQEMLLKAFSNINNFVINTFWENELTLADYNESWITDEIRQQVNDFKEDYKANLKSNLQSNFQINVSKFAKVNESLTNILANLKNDSNRKQNIKTFLTTKIKEINKLVDDNFKSVEQAKRHIEEAKKDPEKFKQYKEDGRYELDLMAIDYNGAEYKRYLSYKNALDIAIKRYVTDPANIEKLLEKQISDNQKLTEDLNLIKFKFSN
ncbi:hypothetical protein NPA13_01210 [Mycoplasma sp. 2045]|uniref:hypothetical protein n=1 Tax=Mycoplasma sp. 2045 TaxID=2967301 RepID=UPI00211C7328|nr:hypothetical protein [Mycoplasma sp. 2045]UUM20617.1 hypothetical protein NPA13_01210 [Mycoplasma sp. 2045]